MALRNSVFPAALALAGCLPRESEPPPAFEQVTYATPETGGDCDVEPITYMLRGVVSRGERIDKSQQAQGALVVAVGESTSVIDCTEDRMQVAMPGAELMTSAFSATGDAFALEVPGLVIGGHRPSIWVRAFVDENDNGTCDSGEPAGMVERSATTLDELEIALTRGDCDLRQ